MNQNKANSKIIIIMVVALFLILTPLSFFLFEEAPAPTNPVMQNTTTQSTTTKPTTTQPTTQPNPCAGGHNYVEGVCSVCGVVDGNYIPVTTTTPTTSKSPVVTTTKTPVKTTTKTPTTQPTTQPTNPPVNVNGTFTITENGVGKAVVVISQNYTQKTLDAANDLLNYIQKISGADLAFEFDNGTMTNDKFYILVGPSKYTQQVGVAQPTGYPNNEKLIVKRVQNALVLIGNDDGAFTGTEFAVTRFLEELGCGWFGTQALWQVVPNNPTITIEQMNIEETPKFISRSTNRLFTNATTKAVAKRWYMGGVETLVGQHFLMSYVGNSFQSSNPNWYARKSNGTQMYPVGQQGSWPDAYWQFCYSNAGLQEKVADVVKNYFATHPNCYVFSITPNDGWSFGTCQCSSCNRYGSDTDLILDFANAVSKIVKRTYPDRYVSVLTYHTTLTAPPSSHPVDSNVEIMFCTETSMTKPTSTVGYIGMAGSKVNTPWKTNFLNYISRTGVQQRSVWKWLCIAAEGSAANWKDMFWVQGNVATDDHAFWKSNGVTYVFYDQGPLGGYREYESSFPLRWPLWYVANRGCWTQDKNGEQLLADACKKLYGNAWNEMLQFYMAMANASAACTADSHAWAAPSGRSVYTTAHVNTINAKVNAAKAKLSSVTTEQAQRMNNQFQLWETTKAKLY